MPKHANRPYGCIMPRLVLSVLAGLGASSVLDRGIARADTYTVQHSFTGKGNDGAEPLSGIVADQAGNEYGTTRLGGNDCPAVFTQPEEGCGAVFKIDSNGQFTLLIKFNSTNGAFPASPLTLVKETLYGTTTEGGKKNGVGVVFSVKTNGSGYRKLHQFTGIDGASPMGAPVVDGLGNVYGVTIYGGPDYVGRLH